MADAKVSLEQGTQTGSILNAQIFTMPEQYRHGKEAKLVEPIKEQKRLVVPVQPPKLPSPLPKPRSRKSTNKALIFSGIIFLLALCVAGYLLLRSVQNQKPEPQSSPPKPVVQPLIQTPEPTKPELVPVPETENPFTQTVVPGKDSDSDGLTDLEENLLYKTNPNLPDSDADGFLDGNEVFHRYNPSGTAPGTLLDAGAVRLFDANGIQLSFPVPWQTSSPSDQKQSFESTTGETIQLTLFPVLDDTQQQTFINTWILEKGGQEQIIKTLSKGGYDLYLTQDKLHALIVFDSKIAEFVYDFGYKTTMDYLQTFQMMLNSITSSSGV